MNTLNAFGGLFSALVAMVSTTSALAQSADTNIFNAPNYRGNTVVVSLEAAFSAGLLGVNGNAGGGRVDVGTVTAAKGAKTGDLTNTASMQGNQQVYATGDVVLQSIRVDEGAKTSDIVNSPVRRGDVEVYAGGVGGSISLLQRGGQTSGAVAVDSVHVCAGAKAGTIINSASTTGQTKIVGGRVAVNSVVLGC